MLTRDLLIFRVRKGQISPTLIDVGDGDLLAVADALTRIPAVGVERGALEEQAESCAVGFPRPKVAAGLVKLLFDRMTFEEPSDEAATLRRTSFDSAARVLRGLPEGSAPEAFEAALTAALPQPIGRVRELLYADHPENRRVIECEPQSARQLLERYNMAQVQGLILRCSRVSLKATAPELLQVRKLLRWLKFCRLVADVQATEPDLVLEVEGPAAILAMEKKYGLQLAQFVAMVPVLGRYELRAEVTMDRRPTALLVIDQRAGLVAQHPQAAGFVPPEIAVILDKLADGPWKIDRTPSPRAVGASGLCVPDVAFRVGRRAVVIEFFHPWHRHALTRRINDLRIRPDPELVLAVDEKLVKADELRTLVDGHPQVWLFHGFPSERGLRKLLTDRLDPA